MTEYIHWKELAGFTQVTHRAAQIAAVLPSVDERWVQTCHLLRNLVVHQRRGGKSMSMLMEAFVLAQAGDQSFERLCGLFEAGLEDLAATEQGRKLAPRLTAELLALAVLTERSSLGTTGARRLRNSISHADLAKIMDPAGRGSNVRARTLAVAEQKSVPRWVAADHDPAFQETDPRCHDRWLQPRRGPGTFAQREGNTMTNSTLPDRGMVFWPVGTGDSTTIVVDDRLVMQVDLHDMASADDDGAVTVPVIDRLAEILPKLDEGSPYLAVFALTHADLDHCRGFGDLLDSEIVIGELWATPRLWRELADGEELCPDAQCFHDEAQRRVKATLDALASGGEPASGDRIRVIGYDDDREDHDYAKLPDAFFSTPGQAITSLDGEDVADRFEAFIHAPFRDDCAGERNETSLAMQIMLRTEDGTVGRLLLLGDLSYVTIKKIFDYSETHKRPERLAWDVMLAAHHCSKKVMYAPDELDEEELKEDLLGQLERHATSDAHVIASSRRFRNVDKPGDNPPHLLARDRYEEIVPNAVVCTGEHPTTEEPRPVVFGVEPGVGLVLLDVDELEEGKRSAGLTKSLTRSGGMLAALGVMTFGGTAWARRRAERRGTAAIREAVEMSRGSEAAPAAAIGFGWQ